MQARVPVLVITGPVGVGKTSVAAAVSNLLGQANVAHALVDMDALRWCSVAPPDDPFNERLGLRNLALVWPSYAAAGVTCLILVDVVEEEADRAYYRQAVPGAEIVVVRLHASVATIHARLERREVGASLEWHRARAVQLAAQMDRDRLEDVLLDTDGRSIEAIAADVLARTWWAQGRP